LVKPQLAENIENQLIYLSQSGRVIGRVSEEQLLNLLKKLQDRKRDSSITFKRV
jgi:DNA-binding TFAR19-related protein (PDSD5 family)